MIYIIENILKGDALLELQNFALSPEIEWRDGSATAAGVAKRGKKNLQLVIEEDWLIVSNNMKFHIEQDNRYQQFKCGLPVLLGGLCRLNRYDTDMRYDWHTDTTFMGFPNEVPEPTITNYAYSIVLSEPDSYDGGVFEIKNPHSWINGDMEVKQFKGNPGDMILFPGNYMHRVTEVTKGSRLVVNGWLTHSIKNPSDLPDYMNMLKLINLLDRDDIELMRNSVMMKNNYLKKVDIIK